LKETIDFAMPSVSRKFALKFVAASAFFFAIIMLAPRPAFAHAVLVRSTPAANSNLGAGGLSVLLTFNSRVDPLRSSLSLLRPDGKVVQLSIGPASSAEMLSAKANVTVKGSYKLRWQALSSDGHITRGEIPFTVR
jgi:copper resistance protein C